jgi:Phospholipase A2
MEVRVAKPKREVKQTVGNDSRSKVSGGKAMGSPAGSGRGAAEGSKSAKVTKRNGGAPTTGALSPVGKLPASVVSELTKIGVSDSEITQQQLSFPVYGNYCGFGHGDPTGKTPPIDAVDAVCREHDRCYALHGLFDWRCDRNLIENMPGAIASTTSPIGKKAGLLALLYFSLVERNLALGETLFK